MAMENNNALLGLMQYLLLLLALYSMACEAVNPEGIVLQAFKHQLQDPLEALSNWNVSDTTPCRWRGIACSTSTHAVTSINLSNIRLNGNIAPQIAGLKFLRRLSLHHNSFSGAIPESFVNLTKLRSLYLNNNTFSGEIPTAIGKLDKLRILDLSNNKFSGAIPANLGLLTNLIYLNLSNNQLKGEVPEGSLLRFNSSSYLGNANLCGGARLGLPDCAGSLSPMSSPLIAPVPGPVSTPARHHNGLSLVAIVLMSVGLFLLFKFGIVVILIYRWMRKDNNVEINLGSGGKLVMFQGGSKVPSSKLMLTAIRKVRKRDVIGEGGFGIVYKLEVKKHRTFAVKKLKLCLESERSFENELETLGTVKHRNLVKLRGFCTAPKVKLLIYDFLSNGSLDQLLHGKKEEKVMADWPIRYRIALGVARGLSYLHHSCEPRIIHGDISSSNILLDAEYEPYLSDFGLATLVRMNDTHVTVSVGGTFGYVAPEFAKSGRATEKVDVYSYGVILLEILSGRRAVDDSITDNHVNLAGWVRDLYSNGKSSEAVDTYLTETVASVEIDLLLEVACHCISLNPEDRPQMNRVVETLELLSEPETSPSRTSVRTSQGDTAEPFSKSCAKTDICLTPESSGVAEFKPDSDYTVLDVETIHKLQD